MKKFVIVLMITLGILVLKTNNTYAAGIPSSIPSGMLIVHQKTGSKLYKVYNTNVDMITSRMAYENDDANKCYWVNSNINSGYYMYCQTYADDGTYIGVEKQSNIVSLSYDQWEFISVNIPFFKDGVGFGDYIRNGSISNDSTCTLPEGYYKKADGTIVNTGDAEYVYDKEIPVPHGLTFKFIMPKAFQKLESKIQLNWNQAPGYLHTEIQVKYQKTVNNDEITKRMMLIKYVENLWGSACSVTKTQTEILDAIHNYDTSTKDLTFGVNSVWGNGGLEIKYYYVRFTKLDEKDGKIHYGNWVRINPVTGAVYDGTDIKDLKHTYDEVTEDDTGKDTVVKSDEYNGTQKDEDGNVQPNGNSYSNFNDYLKGIPGIFSATFTALFDLFDGVGKFGTVFTSVFSGMPGKFVSVIMAGLGLMVVLGIIKFFK